MVEMGNFIFIFYHNKKVNARLWRKRHVFDSLYHCQAARRPQSAQNYIWFLPCFISFLLSLGFLSHLNFKVPQVFCFLCMRAHFSEIGTDKLATSFVACSGYTTCLCGGGEGAHTRKHSQFFPFELLLGSVNEICFLTTLWQVGTQSQALADLYFSNSEDFEIRHTSFITKMVCGIVMIIYQKLETI